MEKVHLLKYPEVNGVVLMDVGDSVVVKFQRGDCVCLLRRKLGKGWLVEGLELGQEKGEREMVKKFREGITKAVKDEVVGWDVGNV